MGVSLLEVKMFQRESKHLLIFIFCPVSLVGKKNLSLLSLNQGLVFIFMLAAKQKYL